MNQSDKNKIIIVHDAFVVKGGAERLALYLSDIFPDAPIVTSIYNPTLTFPELRQKNIISHNLSRFVKHEKIFKQLFPIWFIYFFRKKFEPYDVVISSSTYLAKFISPKYPTKHYCYMHSPFRFLWKRSSYSHESLPFNTPVMKIIDHLSPGLQKIDYKLTKRIDQLITNSQNMANFINEVYHEEAEIIHPPVDMKQYQIGEPSNFYLCVTRLLSYKRVDLAIKACNQLKRNLIIIGDGFERQNLEKIAGHSITFLGKVDEATLKKYYSICKALIFPGIEDFGMVPIEVQASGRPVIAFKAGGVLETVINQRTGILFDCQTPESLIDAIIEFEKNSFSSHEIRNNVQRFDLPAFEKKIKTLILKS